MDEQRKGNRMSSARIRKEKHLSLAVSEATRDMVQGLVGVMGMSRAEVMRRAVEALRAQEWKPATRGRITISFMVNRDAGAFLNRLSKKTGLSRSELVRQGLAAVDAQLRRRLEDIGKAKLDARDGALAPDDDPADDGKRAGSIKLLWAHHARHRLHAEYAELRKTDAAAAVTLSEAIRQVTRHLRGTGRRRLLREQKVSGSGYEVAVPSVPYDLAYEFLDDACVILGVFPRLRK